VNTRQLGTVVKDVASTTLAVFIGVWQVTTGHYNLTWAGIAAALLGVPGIGGAIQIARRTQATDTQLPLSPPPASSLPPSSSSPSSPV
jgi:hypothetical protein